MFIVLFVHYVVIQGYLTMDILIYVISFEPLKNIFYIMSWPPLEESNNIVPSSFLLGVKEITWIDKGKLTAVVPTSRDRRSYTDFICEFSQKDLQELIWFLNTVDSVPLFLEKLICKTAFSSIFHCHLQCINFIRVTADWEQCLLCAIPNHGDAEKKRL